MLSDVPDDRKSPDFLRYPGLREVPLRPSVGKSTQFELLRVTPNVDHNANASRPGGFLIPRGGIAFELIRGGSLSRLALHPGEPDIVVADHRLVLRRARLLGSVQQFPLLQRSKLCPIAGVDAEFRDCIGNGIGAAVQLRRDPLLGITGLSRDG